MIAYEYVTAGGAIRRDRWNGPIEAATRAARNQLQILRELKPRAEVRFLDRETRTWWEVRVDDLAEYGAAILDGHGGEAFALWRGRYARELSSDESNSFAADPSRRVLLSTRTVGSHFGVIGVVLAAHSGEALAEGDTVFPHGCDSAALDDARRVAERAGYAVCGPRKS